MTDSIPQQHRDQAEVEIRCGVITVSDTRTPETDRGGDTVVELLRRNGLSVVERTICPDEPNKIRMTITSWIDNLRPQAILLTGGTGISPRDQTFETVNSMFSKTIPGYGELFRWLSFQEIGAAAMLSRAIGGVVGSTVVLTMPGSPAAVRLAMEKLILPELAHMVHQAAPGTAN